jgi:hypothetical protein
MKIIRIVLMVVIAALSIWSIWWNSTERLILLAGIFVFVGIFKPILNPAKKQTDDVQHKV